MPGWWRRLRIMIDWSFALLFRPDVVKISLDSEAASILREVVPDSLLEGNSGSGGPSPRATADETAATHRA
jgi:hypothetical protein